MVLTELMVTRVLFFWESSEQLQRYLQNHHKLADLDIELIFPDFSDIIQEDSEKGSIEQQRVDGITQSQENLKQKEYIRLAADADILVGWRPTSELLAAAKQSHLFINPGAGINRLIDLFKDQNSRRDKPWILINGHGNSYFTAQHAVAMLFTLLNNIIPHHEWMKSGLWRRGDSFAKSIPLRHKIIGLLGYGAVNQKVHQFLSGFDVDFVILKRSPVPNRPDIWTLSEDKLQQFFKAVDIAILALPITQATENLVTMDELRLLGSEGFLINVARGAIVNEKDLFIALKEKVIAAAAIDVWYDYNPEQIMGKKFPSEYPFHKLSNILLSPHRAASPFDNLERWDEVAENIARFAQGRRDFLNVVDLNREY